MIAVACHRFRQPGLVRIFFLSFWALSLAWFPGCSGGDEDAQFNADYVDDYESDLLEDQAQQAEVARLDLLDDLDDVDVSQMPAAATTGVLRSQSTTAAHGPLSILQDEDPHFYDPSGQWLGEAHDLGAEVIRTILLWRNVVPGDFKALTRPSFNATDPAQYNWAKYDTLIKNAQAHNLRVLITLAAPMPYWASEEPQHCVDQEHNDPKFWSCSWKPRIKEYAKFVTAVGRHFKDQKIWGFTLWNEPNINAFLSDEHGDLQSWRYRKMWFAGRKALRKTAGVRGRVFFGDQANGLKQDPSAFNWAFLRYALCLDPASGMPIHGDGHGTCPDSPRKVWTTGVAFHPYSPDPTVTRSSLRFLESLLDGAAQEHRIQGARPIYITEFGYLTDKATDALGGTAVVTLPQQAQYDNQTDQDGYDDRRIHTLAQYELFDDGPNGKGRWNCGLKLSDGTPKPAYPAYRVSLNVTDVSGGGVKVFALTRNPGRTGVVIVQGNVANQWVPVETLKLDALGYAEVTLPAAMASQVAAWRLCDGQYLSRCAAKDASRCTAADPTHCGIP